MKPIEGQISIDIYPHHSKDVKVEISSTRPLLASKVLIGKTPEQVLSIIPLLYNICGIAQSRAALKAIQQCLQYEGDAKIEIARDMLLLVEIAKEHLLRIFLDWPKLFDIDPGNHQLPFVNQLTTEFKSALFFQGQAFALDSRLEMQNHTIEGLIDNLQRYLRQHVFSSSVQDWLDHQDSDSLLQWAMQTDTIAAKAIHQIDKNGWAGQGNANIQHLAKLDSELLLVEFAGENATSFIAEPKWQGHCYETTSLSRQHKHPLVQSFYQQYQGSLMTRWLARLVELASIPQQLSAMFNNINDATISDRPNKQLNIGIAQVETARGRLVHRVVMAQGLISQYQILAPTEWNFHPQGLITQSLANLITDDKTELRQLAKLMINAIDPCVGYQLRLH